MDDLHGRFLGVDENLEYDEKIAGVDPAKLKSCLLCGKPFVTDRRKVYCDRQHYTTCVKCGSRLDIIDKYFRAGFVPKTCSKACADQVGVETYKQNFMDKYGVTNPMYIQKFADKAITNARHKIPKGKSFAPETRTCVICGKEFIRPHVSPTQCCSPECSTKLRKQTTAKYKLCELCGKPFIATTSRAKYCNGDHYRICTICGKPFKLYRPNATTQVCSNICKDKLTRQTNLAKYGVEVGSQSVEARQKLSDAFYANHPDKVKGAVPSVVTKLCRICGKEFVPSRDHRTICPNPHYRICVVCGKKFEVTKGMGNRTCCSTECTVKRRANTMQERFGVSYSMESPELRKKAQQTTFEHYGVAHPAQSDDVRSKMTQTCQTRYGVENYAQCNQYKQQVKDTCLRKYGVEYVTQTDEFKTKGEQTCLEKYGVRRPMQSREIHQGMWNIRKNLKAADGTPLDSSYEVKVYDFWKSLGLDVERNIPIEYEYNGETRTTFIDFKVDGVLFEVKGLHLLEGVYDYQGVPIGVKLDLYKKHHVVLITDKSDKTIDLFGKPNSTTSNGLKYLDKCPKPLIGVDITLFDDNPEFPYADDRPKCFYDVRVDGKPSAAEAFYDPNVRWKMIYNRIQYSGGFIDNHLVLTAMNVTRTCKQPSWFSKTLANRLISTYCSQDVVYDLAAGWGARADACSELGKTYISCDFNKELVDWHIAQGRDTISWHDGRTFTYDKPCSIFICPPYSDPNTGRCFENYNFAGFDESAQTLTQCQWLKIAMENAPEFVDATMVCKVIDSGWEKFVVETIDNKSHFGINHEYVIHITRDDMSDISP